ncbi:helix-turn-helix domain-containing protein [Micromonospora halophytica]|uniref:Helix-turn-helix domain-containing protein n=1 Tax=Micromonospora halophytica TaxID=47864 RepID=A0A1C5IPV0_9ACTN|nr:Helix-turn-helix domain-containing protein [Micromonospora halophytica]
MVGAYPCSTHWSPPTPVTCSRRRPWPCSQNPHVTALRAAGEVTFRAVRRAVAYVDDHADQPITVDQIAAAAGVRPRAPQLAFRRHHDTTPMRYVRQVRLERAHHDLQAADPTTGVTVTVIATRWGSIAARSAIAWLTLPAARSLRACLLGPRRRRPRASRRERRRGRRCRGSAAPAPAARTRTVATTAPGSGRSSARIASVHGLSADCSSRGAGVGGRVQAVVPSSPATTSSIRVVTAAAASARSVTAPQPAVVATDRAAPTAAAANLMRG